MSKNVVLEVNDLLDLYLLAQNLGDEAWQQEILEELQNFNHTELENKKELSNLWSQYKTINDRILATYQQLRVEPNNSTLFDQILELKQERNGLFQQIQSKQEQTYQAA